MWYVKRFKPILVFKSALLEPEHSYIYVHIYSEQEYDQQAPLLSPTAISMANRISSSIIRELTSNMLMPYTRLKLLDCVGQGKYTD